MGNKIKEQLLNTKQALVDLRDEFLPEFEVKCRQTERERILGIIEKKKLDFEKLVEKFSSEINDPTKEMSTAERGQLNHELNIYIAKANVLDEIIKLIKNGI